MLAQTPEAKQVDVFGQKIYYFESGSGPSVILLHFVQMFCAERMKAGDSYTIERLIDSVVRREDYLNDELKKIRKPTLVIWGREDGLLPVSDADAFVREIPGARKVMIPQCGHAPQLECPTPFHEALLHFLVVDNGAGK